MASFELVTLMEIVKNNYKYHHGHFVGSPYR